MKKSLKRSLQKGLAVLLTAAMTTAALSACSGSAEKKETKAPETTVKTEASKAPETSGSAAQQGAETQSAQEDDNGLMAIYDKIEPLETKTTLRYAGGVGNQLVMPLYIAWASGGLDKAGITLDFYPSPTGPLSVEALTAGEVDFAGSGIGGIAVGCATGNARMLCWLADDSVAQKFYVQKDHPLASKETDSSTGFKGTAEDWKGREVYMPSGSTLQYVMSVGLNKLGLTLQDITPVYMNAENINTALYAKKGEVWGLWNFLCYASDLEKNYDVVMDGHSIGVNLVTAYFTNDKAWEDPQIRTALEKMMEIHFATLEWMQEDEANMEMAARMMTEWCEKEGTAVSYEENLAYLKDTYYYSLEENMDYFTNQIKNDNGEMVKALDMLMGIMDFYIEQGNYTEEDRQNMIKNQDYLFIKDGLESLKGN